MKVILRVVILTIVSILSCYSAARSQQVPKMTPGGRGYLEYLPPGYATSSDVYPTIIFLHGSGERGDGSPSSLNKVSVHGTPKFIKNGHNMCFVVNGVNECFIVLSPQQTENRWGWTNDVMPFVNWAKQNYRIDPNRIYVTGLSMGGDGSWATSYGADNEPNCIAAMAPVSCKGDYNGAKITAQRKIAVWAFHGDKDTAVPLSDGQRPIKGMNTVNPDPVPIFTIVPGGTHGGSTWDKVYSPTNTYYTPNVYQWFLTHRMGPATPKPPVVGAGANKTITLPTNSVSQTGTASDPDGSISSTVWAQVSGPGTATISAPGALTTTFSNLVAGSYVFRLTATDNTGLTASAQVTIQVQPEPPKVPPTANAGADRSITEPANSIVLTGTANDSDGTIQSRSWQQMSGPNTATLSGQSTLTLTASGLIVGSYTFSLTVTDNDGLTGSDVVAVTVIAAPPNTPPAVNAGSDQSFNLPQNSTPLNGSATDADGTVAGYEWSQVSGPNTAVFTPADQAVTVASNMVEGVYTFQLTATDDKGASGTDLVVVTVKPEPPNNPPTANAGTDITITLPTNSTNLNGSGADTDGTVEAYQWSQTSGPNSATIASPTSPTSAISNLAEGNYVFTLTVTDDDGSEASDQVLVSVLPEPPNQPPTADAGTDRSITLPVNSLTLTGSGTDTDGTIVEYQWSQVNGPPSPSAIATPAQATTQVSSLTEGVYSFQLRVTDNDGATGSDIVQVTVFPPANQGPTVDAGTNQSITLPTNTVSLTGTASDADGTITEYLWEQVSGPAAATIVTAGAVSTQVNGLQSGIYVFRLTVTDNDGAKSSDQLTVNVAPQPANAPPTANAGVDKTLTLPDNTTVINGSGSDPDGSIVSYEWSFVSGPGAGSTGALDEADLTLTDLAEGVYVFRLTVTDNRGATATDEVKVFVNAVNSPPVANAGPNKNITLPTSSVAVTGSATDADGTVESYVWEQVSGPNTAQISDPFEAAITVSGLVEGIYVFNLRVTDDEGTTDSDQMQVVVNPEPPNSPPVANTGANQEITLPVNSVTFNGSGTDSDGTIASYQWSQISGPNTATSTPVSQQTITYSNLIAGLYTFRLTVTDNKGANGQRDVTVKVNPQPVIIPPTANAGNDRTITLPVNTTTVTGTGNDPDGTIESSLWEQISGPSIATIVSPASLSTDLSDLVEGIYIFRLTVTDNAGLAGFDEMLVRVLPIPYNLPPIADAGDNVVITLPITTTDLSGSGNDEDGTITLYTWSQISGPSTATTTSVTQPDLSISNLIEGVYLFRLTVTDDKGSTGFDEVRILVQPVPANHPPMANAGDNKVITLPVNSAALEGEGTDPDGTIATYLWEQRSGPSAASLTATNVEDLSVSNMVEGTYVFRLTVTDNQGAFGFDEVNIRVNPPLPNLPPAVSTDGDKTITLPVNTVTIQGTATDSDGTIASIQWTQRSGPSTAQLLGAATTTLTAENLQEGIYVFRVTATDNSGATSFVEVRATVNPEPINNPPAVDAGSDQQIIAPPSEVLLSGTSTDSDGSIASVLWTQVSGPAASVLGTSGSLSTNASGLVPGVYVFRLTATDNLGSSNTDDVSVTVVANSLPTAFAGDNMNVLSPETTAQLSGGGLDTDGAITAYAWTQVSGPNTAAFVAPSSATTEVQGLVVGTYVFELEVTDDNSGKGTDQVTVLVSVDPVNIPPTAQGGDDAGIVFPASTVQLSGGGVDTDGEITSYTWTQVSGPNTATIVSPDTESTSVEGLIVGTYVFQLEVTDDGGATATDLVTVTVDPEPGNAAPTVSAGEDIIISSPASTVELIGDASDDDGVITAYSWVQVNGPAVATIVTPNSATTIVEGLVEGIYTFELTVEDDGGLQASDAVLVTVAQQSLSEVVFPKIFSPNDDNNNDEWTWKNPSQFEGCLLTIYTSSGNKVYEKMSYDNTWDGRYQGKPLEAGGYYFILKCGDGQQTTGGVRIVR